MDVPCPLAGRRCGTFHKGRFPMQTSASCLEHSPSMYRRVAELHSGAERILKSSIGLTDVCFSSPAILLHIRCRLVLVKAELLQLSGPGFTSFPN